MGYRNILKDVNEKPEVRIEDDPIFARAVLNEENYIHHSKTIHPDNLAGVSPVSWDGVKTSSKNVKTKNNLTN